MQVAKYFNLTSLVIG